MCTIDQIGFNGPDHRIIKQFILLIKNNHSEMVVVCLFPSTLVLGGISWIGIRIFYFLFGWIRIRKELPDIYSRRKLSLLMGLSPLFDGIYSDAY